MKQTNESKFRKTPWILTIFLMLLLILFLAYLFFSNKDSMIGTSKTDELAKEESMLRDEIAVLEQGIYAAVTQCSANQGCATPAIEPTIPKPEPHQELKPPETKQNPVKPKFNGSSIPATEYCPPDKIVRPKVIFVMDASPSMEWPVKANDEEISNLLLQQEALKKQLAAAKSIQSFGLGQLGRLLPQNGPMSLNTKQVKNKLNTTKARIRKLYRESPKRMTLAKSVLKGVINSMPADADMSMLMYKSCETIRHYPGSTAAQKKQIISKINRVKPFPINGTQGGSPIAASLSEAAKLVRGSSADNPSLIVMLTDGEESCRASPCAVARRIKKNQPWTAVHLVKLGSRSKASCIATSTGGKVYNPNSVDALTKAINEAQITAPFELKCNKD